MSSNQENEIVLESESEPEVETPIVVKKVKKVRKTKKAAKKLEESVDESTPLVVKKVVKAKRPPSKYNLFVKEQMAAQDIRDTAPKLRMAAIGVKWKAEKTRVASA
jgi:chemotaxis regulatin CheY-phosphate phosphatase CheZ